MWHVGCIFVYEVATGRSYNRDLSLVFFWFASNTKKSFEDFCDFVLIYGLKFLDKFNLSESMDPRIMKKNPQKDHVFVIASLPYFFPPIFPFFFSL